jgi:hypothetical protein
MAVFTLIPAFLLVFVLVVLGLLVTELVKLVSSPQSRHIVKVLVLIPLLLLGALVLAGVLTAAYRFTRVERPPMAAIRVDDPVNGAHVSISSGGVSVKTAQGPGASVPANGVSVQPPSPAAPPAAPPSKGNSNSGTAGVFRAINKAFVIAARSVVTKNEPAAQGPPRPLAIAAVARASTPPGQPIPALTAAAGPSPATPAVAASAVSAAAPMAAKRPDWVDDPPQPRAELYEMAVKAGPWRTPLECEQELDEKIAWAVDSYVAWRIGDEAGSQVQLPGEYAREHLVKEQWVEKINTSLGEMYNLHALLSFDRQVEGKLQDAWSQLLLGARLLLSAAILGGGLLILTMVYGYLKIDLATAGAYRGRLRFVATATILALAAAGAALWRQAAGQ